MWFIILDLMLIDVPGSFGTFYVENYNIYIKFSMYNSLYINYLIVPMVTRPWFLWLH